MPSVLGIDAGLDAVGRVGAAVEILREQFLSVRVGDEVVEQQLELLLRELAVVVPPDRVFGRRIENDELVLGRAAGVGAGVGRKRAARRQHRLAAADRVLIERGLGQVPMNGSQALEAGLVGANGAVPHTRFLHLGPPDTQRRGSLAAAIDNALRERRLTSGLSAGGGP